jgi:ABC-type glycerol-3-phosphate transport system substrate-binding protein
LWVTPTVAFLNREHFRAAGISPPNDGIWSFPEFTDACVQLNGRLSPSGGSALAFGVEELAPIRSEAARAFDETAVEWTLSGPLAVYALDAWAGLMRLNVTPKDAATLSSEEALNRFLQGQYGILLGPARWLDRVRAAPDWGTPTRWTIARLPKGPLGQEENSWGALTFLAVATSGDPLIRLASHLLAQYLTIALAGDDVAESGMSWWGGPPARLSATRTYSAPERDLLLALRTITYVPPVVPPWPDLAERLVRPTLRDVLDGRVSAADALGAIRRPAQAAVDALKLADKNQRGG